MVVVLRLLTRSRVIVMEGGHLRVSAGCLVNGLVIASRAGVVTLDALVAGKLRSDSVDHLCVEATLSIITSIISDEVRLLKLLLHLHLLFNFLHFSGES